MQIWKEKNGRREDQQATSNNERSAPMCEVRGDIRYEDKVTRKEKKFLSSSSGGEPCAGAKIKRGEEGRGRVGVFAGLPLEGGGERRSQGRRKKKEKTREVGVDRSRERQGGGQGWKLWNV